MLNSLKLSFRNIFRTPLHVLTIVFNCHYFIYKTYHYLKISTFWSKYASEYTKLNHFKNIYGEHGWNPPQSPIHMCTCTNGY